MIRRLLALAVLLPLPLVAIDEPEKVPAPETSPEADHPLKLRELIDELDQPSLQEAFRLLTNDYIDRDTLDPLEVNRSALQGMLDRLDFGAMLLTEKGREARNSPHGFFSAKLRDDTGYIRFGRYTKKDVEDLDAALESFTEGDGIKYLVLDLRSPQAQAAFSIAGEILSRFRPPNELLFKIRRPGNDRPTLFVSQPVETAWSGETILLVDRETGNVGEIIAAAMKRENGCLVIGEKTPGLTVEYRDVPLGDDRILRYAIAEVVLEDESSLFQHGVEPDIVTPVPSDTKRDIFRATEKGTEVTKFLFPQQRPRMNEAALVAGTDPEIDYYLLRSNNKPTPWDTPPAQDRALQQAVDLINTTVFLAPEEKKRR